MAFSQLERSHLQQYCYCCCWRLGEHCCYYYLLYSLVVAGEDSMEHHMELDMDKQGEGSHKLVVVVEEEYIPFDCTGGCCYIVWQANYCCLPAHLINKKVLCHLIWIHITHLIVLILWLKRMYHLSFTVLPLTSINKNYIINQNCQGFISILIILPF